jgi:aspartokinase/homoserine dehydrogenase 1
LNVIHGDFLRSEENNIIFGHGLVGGTLINQILESAASIENEKILNSMFLLLPILKVLLNKKRKIRTGKRVRY